MVIRKGDFVKSSVGFNGNVLKIDRKAQTVEIAIDQNSPLSDLFSKATINIKDITEVMPKFIFVVDYLINENEKNEDVIYDEYDNIRSAITGYEEAIKNSSNKYVRLCKRLSRNYEIIETIEEDY